MSSPTQRCPRCGNENTADSYACSFCGKRLKIERIENIRFFKRYGESVEWIEPYSWYWKIYYLFSAPNKAVWDINHKRSKAPGFLILLFNSLLYGLMGLAFFSHFNIVSLPPLSPLLFWYNLSMFIAFFVFGLVFQFLFFAILIWLFTKGANYAVGFSERLEARFGEEKEDSETYREKNLSPFSIYKGGVLLQKMESYKFKMMLCAFSPFLIINGIKIIIILIAFPTVNINMDSSFYESIFNAMFSSPVWPVLDVIDAITLAAWVPLLMTLSIRELSNSSTFRALISSYIIGILVAIFFFFLRPTLFG
ncbi:MAG: hypothetical protein ACTSRI_01390 [Promethearchaeota archaeon]